MPQEITYPDTIKTDDGRLVRISQANPNQRIRVRKHNLRIGDIPLTAGELGCGHVVRGIAFQAHDLVYCDKHPGEIVQTEVIKTF
jgi:hypothetical protein